MEVQDQFLKEIRDFSEVGVHTTVYCQQHVVRLLGTVSYQDMPISQCLQWGMSLPCVHGSVVSNQV